VLGGKRARIRFGTGVECGAQLEWADQARLIDHAHSGERGQEGREILSIPNVAVASN